jgi:DNA repair protein RadD
VIEFRDYQIACIDKIWEKMFTEGDQLIQLPTGSGKTIIFVGLLERCLKKENLSASVLVNKIKLVDQTKEKLLLAIKEEEIGLFCGSLGDYEMSRSITVASIQSISRRTPVLDLLIIDEAHNAENSPTYNNFIKRCREANPKIKVVRFTATPYTMGGYIFGPEREIKSLTYQRTLNEMIDEGYLVPPSFKSSKEKFDLSGVKSKRGEFIVADLEKLSRDAKKVSRQVEDALPRLTERKKIVWSATCIEHATMIKSEIEKFEPASVIHSDLSGIERRKNLKDFETGSVRHLVSIMIVTEGYDFPPIDGIVMMRPTRSAGLYVQLVGRGLRSVYAPGHDLKTLSGRLEAIQESGKTDCLVLDYGEVVENLGHPNAPYIPGVGNKGKKAEKRALICPACDEINFLPVKECRSCAYAFVKNEAVKVERTKSLTDKAAEYTFNASGKREKIVPVLAFKIDNDYKSKAGHDCIKISYATLDGPVLEYIKKGTFFHRKFNTEMMAHKKGPKSIKIEKDGKWSNVIERIYK